MKWLLGPSKRQTKTPFTAMTSSRNPAGSVTLLILIALVLALLVAHSTNARSARQVFSSPSPPVLSRQGVNVSTVYGKIQFVDSFPDYRVKAVNSFPNLKVKKVASFPNGPGQWQIVNSFPDFKIKLVDSFPDFTIQYVNSFPGVD